MLFKLSHLANASHSKLMVMIIDNKIYNSKLNTSHQLRRRKCHQFSRDKKWRTRVVMIPSGFFYIGYLRLYKT